MSRTVIDLDARASVLDAADRVRSAPQDGDLALVVAAGAPLLRSAVFLEVVRGIVGPRRLSIVTTDARARSIASSAHVPAYSSLAALDHSELDPTERLTPARRAAIARGQPAQAGIELTGGRVLAVAGSLAAAILILVGVVLPEARVVVSPTSAPLEAKDLEVRAGGGGDFTPETLTAQISAKVPVLASGSRVTETRATGAVRLQNKTAGDIRIPRGSVFSTANGVQFLSTEEKTLPRSVIIPPFTLNAGRVDVAVEAAVAGDPGNVAAGRIVNGPDNARYEVTNPNATSGGKIERTPFIQAQDYDAAVAKAPDQLNAEARTQLQRWVATPPLGKQVVNDVLVRQTSLGPARVDVVGREEASTDLTVNGIATAYAVRADELRNATLAKLGERTTGDFVVDPATAEITVKSVKVTENGVVWTIDSKATQVTRVDSDRIGRLLAGRPAGDAASILRSEDLTLVRIERTPSWWPFMPLLDGRITVQREVRTATAGP